MQFESSRWFDNNEEKENSSITLKWLIYLPKPPFVKL